MTPHKEMAFKQIPFMEEWKDDWGNELNIFDWAINNPFSVPPNVTLYGSFAKNAPLKRVQELIHRDAHDENKTIYTFKLTRVNNTSGVNVYYYESRSFDNHVVFAAEVTVNDQGKYFGRAQFKRNNIVFSEFIVSHDKSGNSGWVKTKQMIDYHDWDWDFVPVTSEDFFRMLGSELKRILRHHDDFRTAVNQFIRDCREEAEVGPYTVFMNEKQMELYRIFKEAITNIHSPLHEKIRGGTSLNGLIKHLDKLRKRIRD